LTGTNPFGTDGTTTPGGEPMGTMVEPVGVEPAEPVLGEPEEPDDPDPLPELTAPPPTGVLPDVEELPELVDVPEPLDATELPLPLTTGVGVEAGGSDGSSGSSGGSTGSTGAACVTIIGIRSATGG